MRQAAAVRRAHLRGEMEEFVVPTTPGPSFYDLTERVQTFVRHSGIRDGQLLVASMHTTAAVVINENEPLLLEDFAALLHRLAPRGGYAHDDLERRPSCPPDEPLNGHAHCQHLLLTPSVTLLVRRGQVQLGQWQRIMLVELDQGRTRQVQMQVLGW